MQIMSANFLTPDLTHPASQNWLLGPDPPGGRNCFPKTPQKATSNWQWSGIETMWTHVWQNAHMEKSMNKENTPPFVIATPKYGINTVPTPTVAISRA